MLQNLPKTLNDTYDRMLANIPDNCKSYARQVLIILCITKSPLTVDQLIDAVAVDLDQTPPQFDPNRKLADFNAVQSICPSFTESYKSLDGRTLVRIAHFSVQQYLEAARKVHAQDAPLISFSKQDAHALMASVCLAVLMDPKMPSWHWSVINLDNILFFHPLADYAIYTWTLHFRESNQSHRVARQVLQLFKDTDRAYRLWAPIAILDASEHIRRCDHIQNPLFLSSFLGFVDTVRDLCRDYAFWSSSSLPSPTLDGLINAGYGDCPTPLTRLKRMQLEGNGLLFWKFSYLSRYDRLNVNGPKSGKATVYRFEVLAENVRVRYLIRSSIPGEQLLLRKALTTPRIKRYSTDCARHVSTTLLAGVASGNVEVVRTLFEYGGDFGKENDHGDMALLLAVLCGNAAMVRFLLEHDATLKMPDDIQEAVLTVAEAEKWEDVVVLLEDMKRGALLPPGVPEGSAPVDGGADR